MDRIVAGYLKDFVDEHGLNSLAQSDQFERFVNYCLVAREYPEHFDLEQVCVGDDSTLGIDGAAIFVNDHLVYSKDQIDFFRKNLRRLDVHFMFVQAKTSSSFDMGDISTFMYAVHNFFTREPSESPSLRGLWDLKEYIYDASIDMVKNPRCSMFYVSNGRWNEDPQIVRRVDKERDSLASTNLFSGVSFTPLDANAIRTLYRELRHKIEKEVVFEKHTILPQIDGVEEAYIGILPCRSYVDLITGDNGQLRKSLFYDNVRDFQGNNPVNSDIQDTVQDSQHSDRFVLLNNGVTIVAKGVRKTGTSFLLQDFQIVNGCQTSHVLFHNVTALSASSYLPVKLIITEDVDTTNEIIKATNRQTEVKVEAFESLSPFHKKLEEFYQVVGKNQPNRLYYERRSKQYDNVPVKKHQVVTLPAQLTAFIAMFLNEPHSTHRYYGELLKANRNRVFLENHSPYPYFVSAYAAVVLEQTFQRRLLERSLRRFKYQLLMLYRALEEDSERLPYLNNRRIDSYCEKLLDKLARRDDATSTFVKSASILTAVLKESNQYRTEGERLRAFTTALVARTDKELRAAAVQRTRGVVKTFSDTLGYGFIKLTNQPDVFVHYSEVAEDGYKTLIAGQIVEFAVVETAKGPQAREVTKVASGKD